jgi:hypothetical protein
LFGLGFSIPRGERRLRLKRDSYSQAILVFASLLQLAPLVVLGGGQYLSVFKLEQLHAFAYMFLQLNAQAWNAFLSPPLADYLSPYNLAPAALGEGSLMLWLLVAGVNAQRWKEQASAAGIRA